MTDYCPTCKFFRIDNKKRSNGIGLCHRYPRIHIDNHDCYYVDVREETDWCGEWRPIDKEVNI
jgi:hypothetical protein